MTTTDLSARNAELVGGLYAAFGAGDVPTIFAALDPAVSWDGDWISNAAQADGGPDYLAPRHGPDGVGAFFAALSACTVHDFQVHDIVAGPERVVAVVELEITNPRGGCLRDEELHLWRISPEGKVTSVRHYCDTAKHLAAWQGADATG